MSITSRIQEIFVEGIAPELKSLISLNKKVIFDTVVVGVVDWTVEGKVLQAFNGKDENAFAVFITLALKQKS